MKASFQINMYDQHGDVREEGVYLHLSDDNFTHRCILKMKDVQELDKLIDRLGKISKEIHDNF